MAETDTTFVVNEGKRGLRNQINPCTIAVKCAVGVSAGVSGYNGRRTETIHFGRLYAPIL